MKKKLLIGLLAVGFFAVMVLPTQGAQYTLTSLGDQLTKIVMQVKHLKTNGTLPAKYVTYDRSKTGLKSTTVQGAVDEIGVKLSKILSGNKLTVAGYSSASLQETSWSGATTAVRGGALVRKDITATFTPTSETEGTWTSNPYNVFDAGSAFGSSQLGTDGLPYTPAGTYTGSYKIIGNVLLAYQLTLPTGASSDDAVTKAGYTAFVATRGNTITFTDTQTTPNAVTVLTHQ